jgi:hypothetical protein
VVYDESEKISKEIGPAAGQYENAEVITWQEYLDRCEAENRPKPGGSAKTVLVDASNNNLEASDGTIGLWAGYFNAGRGHYWVLIY